MNRKVKLTPRVDVAASSDDDHLDAENVRKQLDKEESMDITATGGFSANTTIDKDEDPLQLTGSSTVEPANYKWKPRRSRSERVRRHSLTTPFRRRLQLGAQHRREAQAGC